MYKPNEMSQDKDLEEHVNRTLDEPLQLRDAIKYFSPKEIKQIIHKELHARKTPGYDLITGRILKELSRKGIVHLTSICNSIIRTGHFPVQWKVAQVLMIPKPRKPRDEVNSYRPISLLPIISKVFENALL